MALTDIPNTPEFVRYWSNSGQRALQALTGSVANDPTAARIVLRRALMQSIIRAVSENLEIIGGGMKMLIRLSLALLLSLLVSVPSHAQFARRVIEHRMMGNAFSAAACKADAARLCPGVADDGLPECLMRHKNLLSFGCAKEINKLERQ